MLIEAEQIHGHGERRAGERGHMCSQGCNHTDDGICSEERQQLITSLWSLLGMLCVKNSPADLHAGTHWWVRGVPQCEHLVLAVIVVIVPAYVVVMRSAVLSILGTLLILPHIGLP